MKKHILCYGDSNTWGYCAESDGGRFDDESRWTMQLQHILGDSYFICEEGLNGRTSVFEDPLFEGRNGFATLTPVLRSHKPLDLLIIMLGTNDCKQRFAATAQNIADGVSRIVTKAKQLDDIWKNLPRILVVAPIIIGDGIYKADAYFDMGDGCVEKSVKLPSLLKEMTKEQNCFFYDSNEVVVPNKIDFIHFNSESHTKLAAELAKIIPEIL